MKPIIIILTAISICFTACTKQSKMVIKKQQEEMSCDFGIKVFNNTKRVHHEEKKPLHPPGKPPKPPVVTISTWLVLLDFNGRDIQNTSWGILNPGTVSSSGLTNTEIETIIANVKLDWPGLKLEFTTDENFYNSHIGKKQVIVATDSWEWYGNGAGGVAFMNSFINSTGSPGIVFTSRLSYNTWYISKAISHELGHTINIPHRVVYNPDCSVKEQYDPGYLNNDGMLITHIMGYPYKGNATFSTGKNLWSCYNDFNEPAYIQNLIGLK